MTTEFAPGFRNSEFSYVVSLLDETVIRDLDLHGHGLDIITREGASITFGPEGHLWLPQKLEDSMREIARFSEKDARNTAFLMKSLKKSALLSGR